MPCTLIYEQINPMEYFLTMINTIIHYLCFIKPNGFWGYIGVFGFIYGLAESIFYMRRQVKTAIFDMERILLDIKDMANVREYELLFEGNRNI